MNKQMSNALMQGDNTPVVLNGVSKEKPVTISTVEVAEMMGIDHYKVIRKLEGDKTRKGYIQVLADSQMGVADYFIESTYIDAQGKHRKCYDCTKMGCDFLANKFTGEKGIIFTAKYVERFNKMELALKQQVPQLSKKHELAIKIYDGGSGAIIAHKELVKIEVAEETARLKDGTNKVLSAQQVVDMLGVKKLTTTLLHEWFVENEFGEWTKYENERNRLFQPSQKFVDYVAVKGYSFTGKTVKGNKVKVIYSTSMVDRLLERHMASIVKFVQARRGVA